MLKIYINKHVLSYSRIPVEPKIFPHDDEIIEVQSNSNVVIKCDATGFPLVILCNTIMSIVYMFLYLIYIAKHYMEL